MILPSKTKIIRLPKSRFNLDLYIGISRSIGVNFEWYKLRPRHGSTYSLHLPFVVLSVDVFDTVKMKEIFDDLARFSEMQMRLDDEKKENETNSNQEGS